MKITGNAGAFNQIAAENSKANVGEKPKVPVDVRIRSLEKKITRMDSKLNKNIDELKEMKKQLSTGIKQREKLEKSWKRLAVIAVVTGFGASMVGGGIPALALIGICGISAIKGGIDYTKSDNLEGNLKTIDTKMTIYQASHGVGNEFTEAERDQLYNELKEARQEKTQEEKDKISQMAGALKKDGSTNEEKTGKIEDLGNMIKINGISLRKKSSA